MRGLHLKRYLQIAAMVVVFYSCATKTENKKLYLADSVHQAYMNGIDSFRLPFDLSKNPLEKKEIQIAADKWALKNFSLKRLTTAELTPVKFEVGSVPARPSVRIEFVDNANLRYLVAENWLSEKDYDTSRLKKELLKIQLEKKCRMAATIYGNLPEKHDDEFFSPSPMILVVDSVIVE